MQMIEQYMPYLLLVAGVLALFVPGLRPLVRLLPVVVARWTRRAPGPAATDPKREFVAAVLTILETCQRAGCRTGIEQAKALLAHVDQLQPVAPAHADTEQGGTIHA